MRVYCKASYQSYYSTDHKGLHVFKIRAINGNLMKVLFTTFKFKFVIIKKVSVMLMRLGMPSKSILIWMM